MRVLTWNIAIGKRLCDLNNAFVWKPLQERFDDAIAWATQTAAHVVALQEINVTVVQVPANVAGDFHVLSLNDEYDPQHTVRSNQSSVGYMVLVRKQLSPNPPPPLRYFESNRFYNQISYTRPPVFTTIGNVTLLTWHNEIGNEAQENLRKLDDGLSTVRKDSAPVIVAGDLNVRAAFLQNHPGNDNILRHFQANSLFSKSVDYVIANRKIKGVDIPGIYISDACHFPYCADVLQA